MQRNSRRAISPDTAIARCDSSTKLPTSRPRTFKELPAGYYVAWSGQYENQQRARNRLLIVIPIVLVIIFDCFI